MHKRTLALEGGGNITTTQEETIQETVVGAVSSLANKVMSFFNDEED